MKILVVDDDLWFVEDVIDNLRKGGLDATGIVPRPRDIKTPDGDSLTEEAVLALVRNADVIFLDHNMPWMKGDLLLEYWKEKGVDFANKRVVGISASSQDYLEEQFKGLSSASVDTVKRFLGL